MSHINNMVDDLFTQISLYSRLSNNLKRPFIGVYIARHNLQPFIDEFIARASIMYMASFKDLKMLEVNLERCVGVKVQVLQKPEPINNNSHLILTTGNLTAIIFDYEN